ncbi:unnamed protein product [Acanthoscelides obtectus]|uniref:Solute-binding protein family 3/N-terminal domain-containing protein n=1 Tax=Acanthoscelides obtectus TaxID=200917 RepID=A0A9P0L0M9_ACAOB|nr:unnamed protein product [Acanthoscelides obtectus]CAK1654838.1 hypothetical protein AOBTE_LOCUS18886 [Acanthoscelides obtectus]
MEVRSVLLYCIFLSGNYAAIALNIHDFRLNTTIRDLTTYSLSSCIAGNPKQFQLGSNILFSEFIKKEDKSIYNVDFFLKALGSHRKLIHYNILSEAGKRYENFAGCFPDNLIIHIGDAEDLKNNAMFIDPFNTSNPTVIVICTNASSKPDRLAKHIFNVSLARRLLNTIILLPEPRNITTFNIYSWSSKKGHCLKSIKVHKVNSCSFGNMATIEKIISSRRMFNKCTLNVGYTICPPHIIEINQTLTGIEVDLLSLLSEKLGFQLNFSYSMTFGGPGANHAEALLNKLENHEIDFAIGGFVRTENRCIPFDCSHTINLKRRSVWCVPRVPERMGSTLAGYVWNDVWIYVLMLYLSLTLCTWLVSRSQDSYFKYLHNIMFAYFAAIFLVAQNRQPKTWYGRYFSGLILLLGMYIGIILGDVVTSILTSLYKTERYNTIDDVFKYDLATHSSLHSILHQKNESDDEYLYGVPIKTIKRKWIYSKDVTETLLNVTKNHISFCLSDTQLSYYMTNDEKVRSIRSKIKCIKSNNEQGVDVIIWMRKRFLQSEAFVKNLKRIIDAGFIEKWTNYLNLQNINQGLVVREESIKDAEIKFEEIKTIFVLLLFGHALAAFVLILELWHSKRSRKYR